MSLLTVRNSRNRSLVEAIPELLFRISQDGAILEIRKPQKVASLKDNHDGVEGHSPKDEIFDMIPTEIQHIVMPHVATALESGQTQVFEFQMSVDGNMSYYEGRVLANGYGWCVTKATLLAAKKDPDSYRGLIVRIAGYSAFFTSLAQGASGIRPISRFDASTAAATVARVRSPEPLGRPRGFPETPGGNGRPGPGRHPCGVRP